MLLYSNTSYWRVVFELRGTLVFAWKNILAGLFVALVTFAISYLKHHSYAFVLSITPTNNVGWNMMGGTIVFAVVFRTNLGWQRYWEAIGQLQLMYSKWADAFTQCVAFVSVTLVQLRQDTEDASVDERILFLQDRIGSLQRNFSLLSALAAHRLTHGDVQRLQRRSGVADWKDQVVLRRDLRVGDDLTGATKLPGFVKVANRSQLNETLDNSWFGDFCLTDVPRAEEIALLEDASDHVHAVMYWIVHDLSELSQKLSVSPPIQSRMYQELSNGMLGFQNAVKIADIPFPFQFTQLFNVLVIALSVFIPIYAATFSESMVLSPFIAYVVHQSILVINQVAMQLESPFGSGYNDISVRDFHARFMETIIEINPNSKYKSGESMRRLTGRPQHFPMPDNQPGSSRPSFSIVDTLGDRERSTKSTDFLLMAPRSNVRKSSFNTLFGAVQKLQKQLTGIVDTVKSGANEDDFKNCRSSQSSQYTADEWGVGADDGLRSQVIDRNLNVTLNVLPEPPLEEYAAPKKERRTLEVSNAEGRQQVQFAGQPDEATQNLTLYVTEASQSEKVIGETISEVAPRGTSENEHPNARSQMLH